MGEGLKAANLPENIMVDFSHANSLKQCKRQIIVGEDVGEQIASGDQRIKGIMLESHLVEGRQDVEAGVVLTYGQSITDACLGWDDTVDLMNNLAAAVQARRAGKN